MPTKAELQEQLDELGVEYAKSASKDELADLVAENTPDEDAPAVEDEENGVVEDDEEPGLEGTPVDAVVPEEDYVQIGVPVPDLGPEAEEADEDEDDEPAESVAKDDSEPLLEPTDPGPIRVNNLVDEDA